MDMIFFKRTKNGVFKYSETMPRNIEKKVNPKDKYMCYLYKESQIFVFIWSHIFTTKKAEDMEKQNAEHL